MPSVTEKAFTYVFPANWRAEKFDKDAFYLGHFSSFAGGTKAVDVLAFGDDNELWLIEQKDYRQGAQIKAVELLEAVARKMSGTLACLVAARSRAATGSASQILAHDALHKYKVRCALHIEQPQKPSKLHPQVIDPKSIRDKLRQTLGAIDPHSEGGDKSVLNGRGRLPCAIT
ncbi:MAG: hypothetical protein H6935_04780 [Thiobacillus sp.]|nr:hypothetical protein [Thiobacillus sp.]